MRDRAAVWVRVFFALTFVVYTCVSPYIGAINNPNENVRTYMTMAIVEQHTFRIDKMIERHGWINDMARVPEKSGDFHFASVKGPAVSYFGVPFYWAFVKVARWFGHPVPTERSPPADREWWLRAATITLRLFAVQLPCFLFLVWFERWLRRTTPDAVLRLSAVAAVGLGTNYLAYAIMFVSHAPFAVAAFGSFAVTLNERVRSRHARGRRASQAFLAGFLAGMITLLEYHALPVSLLLGIYAITTFWRPTRLLAFTVGGLLDVGAMAFYQWKACGSAIQPCHRYAESFPWLRQRFFGIGAPDLGFAGRMAVSHAFGFFGTSPFMWLGLLAIPLALLSGYGARRERRERRLATLVWLTAMIALWIMVSAASNPHGGWSVGPRYLGAAPPFFAYGATCALEKLSGRSVVRRVLGRALAGGLAAASIVQTGLISIIYNTLPETASRPLTQLALPLARAGFVPHHAAELVGWMAPHFWYGVASCLGAAALLAALVPCRDRVGTWLARLPLTMLVAYVGLRPAWSTPSPLEPTDPNLARYFADIWEPRDRDFLHTMRERAERYGSRGPCLWYRLADRERLVGFTFEAMRDEKRAGDTPKARCR
jgi:hypothetical protein